MGGGNATHHHLQKEYIMANKNQGGNGGKTSQRGFASMDPNMQRQIASEGGRAAHRSGNAHEFTSEEARAAGRLSHKNSGNKSGSMSGSGNRGSESGSGNRSGSDMSGMRGGSSEQHAEAGRQSHKNQK
jgi:hypothetical protein